MTTKYHTGPLAEYDLSAHFGHCPWAVPRFVRVVVDRLFDHVALGGDGISGLLIGEKKAGA